MTGELDMQISRWEPAVVGPVDGELVTFIRSTVAAAKPRRWQEARNTLKWGFAYLLWAFTPGLDLDARELFAAGRIDAYNAAALSGPLGTRNAVMSHLKRLHPDVGFAGTTRIVTEPAAAATTMPPVMRSPAVLAPAVEAAIERYVPQLIGPADWAAVGHLVHDVVRVAAPRTPMRATGLCRDMSYLAVWSRHDLRRVSIPTTLAGETIESFLDELIRNNLGLRSVASFAANLHSLREAHGIELNVTRRTFPAPSEKAPYNQAEVATFFETAARIPSAGRRRHAYAALSLIFGVGALPGEIALIEPHHISNDATPVVKLLAPSRQVTVLAPYADDIARARSAAIVAGDRYMLGGQGAKRIDRLVQLFSGGPDGNWKVRVDSTRGRATWLVESAITPGLYPTVVEHLHATGLTTFARLGELLPYITARRHEHIHVPLAATASADTGDATIEVT